MATSATRRALFRPALGRSIGMGHLRRCEALGAELASRGWEARVLPHGFGPDEDPLRGLPLSPGFTPLTAEPAGLRWDLLVVDSYVLGLSERAALRSSCRTALSFLDAPSADGSDMAVDVNCGADPARYAAAGFSGRLLAGPDYFPVRPALLAAAEPSRRRDRSGPARHLLVTFGGSDWHGLAARTVSELAAVGNTMEVKVLAGDLGRSDTRLRQALAGLKSAALVAPGTEPAELFRWADLCVSAAGLTKYELALFGVPAIIVAIADNQETGVMDFAARGSAEYLGPVGALAPGQLAGAVQRLAADSRRLAAMSASGMRLVDGRGAARIVDEVDRFMEGSA